MDTTIDEERQKKRTETQDIQALTDSTSTSSLPPQMVSIRIHVILDLALVLRVQLVNGKGCRHRHVIVDSSDLDAGITFSGESWVMQEDDPSANGNFFGGSTMRTSNNGDSVEFAFKGSSVYPHVIPCTCGRSFQKLMRVVYGWVLAGSAVVVFGDVGRKHAKFSVDMDGRAVGEGTAFSASGFRTFVPLWREDGLQNGEHRLRITHDDISGLWLSVDKFLCVPASALRVRREDVLTLLVCFPGIGTTRLVRLNPLHAIRPAHQC